MMVVVDGVPVLAQRAVALVVEASVVEAWAVGVPVAEAAAAVVVAPVAAVPVVAAVAAVAAVPV